MNIDFYDNLAATIRSLNGVRTAIYLLSLSEEDEKSDLFTVLNYELQRNIYILVEMKGKIKEELN